MVKIMLTAVALTMVSSAVIGQTTETKAPSWQAVCGYKWRMYKAEHAGVAGRDALNEFRRKSVVDGGCGAKATRGANDEAIKQYIESHPVGPKTEIDPAIDDDNGNVILVAKRGRK